MEKYVKLSDVLSIVRELQGSNINKFKCSVESLQTINDPKGQLDMKEFNMFSCGKASLEIALDKLTK